MLITTNEGEALVLHPVDVQHVTIPKTGEYTIVLDPRTGCIVAVEELRGDE